MPILRRSFLLASLLALAACATSLTGGDSASLRVEGSRVTVVAPEGLCIDPTSPDVGRAGGFLLIGDCALVRNGTESIRPLNGVITVSISTGGLDNGLEDLEAFLTGPGKAGLSRTQSALTVTVLDTRRTDNALFLKIRDVSRSERRGGAADFWRVFFPAAGRLVTASVVAFSEIEIQDARAIALLSELENRTSAANAQQPASMPVLEAAPEAQAEAVEPVPEPDVEVDPAVEPEPAAG